MVKDIMSRLFAPNASVTTTMAELAGAAVLLAALLLVLYTSRSRRTDITANSRGWRFAAAVAIGATVAALSGAALVLLSLLAYARGEPLDKLSLEGAVIVLLSLIAFPLSLPGLLIPFFHFSWCRRPEPRQLVLRSLVVGFLYTVLIYLSIGLAMAACHCLRPVQRFIENHQALTWVTLGLYELALGYGTCAFVFRRRDRGAGTLVPLDAIDPNCQSGALAMQNLDLPFAQFPDGPLCLDLYLPDGVTRPPLVVFIHGGGWQAGARKPCRLAWLVEHGYAVASVDYRLSSRALFPAQLHDCKGAVRWLRAHAAEYGYDATRLAVGGTSAGGHLALLLGTSSGNVELEGEVGGNLEESSHVDAVLDYFGPADFILRAQTQPAKTEEPGGTVYRLLGHPVRGHEAAARRASGVWHITRAAAPVLIFHGTADQTVLMDQAERVLAVYREHGVEAALHVVPGAGHGGDAYFSAANRELVVAFLARHLRAR